MSGAVHDPVLTQVIGSYVLAAAEEMGVSLMRTAYSTNIKERGDCSTAIFDARGDTLAQASHVPLHLASLMGLVRRVTEDFGREEIEPGDVFLANDPYQGVGSQLNDIAVAAPVFWEGEIVAYVATIAHHADVGGRFPGSEAAASATVYEEGIRLPAVRLYRRGELQRDVLRIIQTNSRVPRNIEGDMRAQVAAVRLGLRRMEELHARYGREVVSDRLQSWLDYAETRLRAAIDELPPGTYSFSDHLEEEGIGSGAHRLQVAITVADGALKFDFTGCPPQVGNSHNVPWLALLATVYYAAKVVLDPEVPPNSGYYRALEVVAPEGTIVNAAPPAAVGTRNHTCQKLVDVIMGAFSLVAPERVVAGCASSKLMIVGGVNPRTGLPFIDYEASAGGLGARPDKDGLDVCRAHMTNTSNLPIEALEMEDPLLVLRYEMVPDTGGAGRYRGGLGMRRDTKMLGDGFTHSGFAIGHKYPGVGLAGGRRGRITAPSMLVLNPGGKDETPLDPAAFHVLAEGDVLSVSTPGGGGYGDPYERDVAAVLQDVIEGKVTPEGAEADYGVAVDAAGNVDEERTERLRGAARAAARS